MPGEQIAPGELVSAVLALVRSIAGVCGSVLSEWVARQRAGGPTGSHVSCYMLRTGKGCVADGTFVIASHLEREGGGGDGRRLTLGCKSYSSSSSLPQSCVVELRDVWLC